MSDDIKIGTILASKFEIMSVLGSGKHCTVYKGYQNFTKKSVALKLLNSSALANMDEFQRFKHEAQIGAELAAHKGIIDIIDFGAAASAGQVYIVMNLIEGLTLKELLLQKGRLDERLAIGIFKQIIDALAFVHNAKIIYRSLDPSEIMLTHRAPKDGDGYQVTVIDFGSAVKQGDSFAFAQPGKEVGKPGYASPEQSRGEDIDARTDIYTVGRMLYEALVGQLPEGVASFPSDSAISQNVQAAVLKAADENRDKRFSSMKELAQALSGSGDHDDKKDMWGWAKKIFK